MITLDFTEPHNLTAYQEKWRAHLRTVAFADPNNGLSADAVRVLAESDDTPTRVRLILGPRNEPVVPAQRTPHTSLAKRLEDAGLLVILEYHPAGLLGPDGRPIGREGCTWVWTPFGLKVAQGALAGGS